MSPRGRFDHVAGGGGSHPDHSHHPIHLSNTVIIVSTSPHPTPIPIAELQGQLKADVGFDHPAAELILLPNRRPVALKSHAHPAFPVPFPPGCARFALPVGLRVGTAGPCYRTAAGDSLATFTLPAGSQCVTLRARSEVAPERPSRPNRVRNTI